MYETKNKYCVGTGVFIFSEDICNFYKQKLVDKYRTKKIYDRTCFESRLFLRCFFLETVIFL